MGEVYLVDAVRTPIGRRGGSLSEIPPVRLGAYPLRALLARNPIDPATLDDVILGCVTPVGEQGANLARLVVLYAGLPHSVPGVQLNRMCGSGQQAIHFGAQAIASGDMELVVAGGVESMSRVAMGSDWPTTWLEGLPTVMQGISAEMMAAKWSLSRSLLDDMAIESHRRAALARDGGYFDSQIAPVEGKSGLLTQDEGIRWPADEAKVRNLRPAFKEDGVVTAAGSSQISDGAAMVLLASESALKTHGLMPRARLVTRVVVGSDPELMLDGPIPASRRALERAGLTIHDIDVIEINEAFAPVVAAWQKELEANPARVNPNGGAMALGHPLGASGAVLMAKLLNELERSGGRYGLQSMCIGHGMATATIIERL
ncbi:MAG: thiolase family protein [Ardenticatenales bacterium]|nr:thiolase family protein [Ardenticatenales bacterium]